jgi:hypothetical protein
MFIAVFIPEVLMNGITADSREQKPLRRLRGKSRLNWATLFGVGMILVLAELVFRPAIGELDPFNARPVREDGPDAPVVTIRDHTEGLATAHLTLSCARLTGVPEVARAPYLLIVGDSFVAAEQVNDNQTMGAQLQRISAAVGKPVNVRQYGWVAAGPAKYIVEAPDLLERWHPAMTTVVLNEDDFYSVSLSDRWAMMQVDDGKPAEVRRVDPGKLNHFHALAARASQHSALFKALYMRFSLDVWPALHAALTSWQVGASDARQGGTDARYSPTMPQIVQASLMGLQRAYGPHLELIFAAEPGLQDQPDNEEEEFLRQCSVQKIACFSTREAFDRARDSGEFLAAGFCNSRPAAGHYNRHGHQIIAENIWTEYQRIHKKFE